MRLLLVVAMLVPLTARAEAALPTPLRVALAHDHRSEVLASRARIRAAAERPEIVSALDDPLVSASIAPRPIDTDYNGKMWFHVERNPRSSKLRVIEIWRA